MKEILIQKYMAGTSSREDERQLLVLLQAEAHPSAEDQTLLDMLALSFPPVEAREEWLEEDESELFDQLMAGREHETAQDEAELHQALTPPSQPPRRRVLRIALRIMASAAILTAIFFASRQYRQPASEENVAVTYIYGNKVEDPKLAMDMMQETMGEIFDRPSVESELSDLFN